MVMQITQLKRHDEHDEDEGSFLQSRSCFPTIDGISMNECDSSSRRRRNGCSAKVLVSVLAHDIPSG
nr:hypothetical protein CFP56_79569 [Quercus suber]